MEKVILELCDVLTWESAGLLGRERKAKITWPAF